MMKCLRVILNLINFKGLDENLTDGMTSEDKKKYELNFDIGTYDFELGLIQGIFINIILFSFK